MKNKTIIKLKPDEEKENRFVGITFKLKNNSERTKIINMEIE